MKVLALIVSLAIFIAGCGSASSANTVTTANSVQMQSGQWEYVITPDNGSSYPYTMLLDANVPGTNVQFAATNGLIFQPSHDLNPKVLPIWCSAYNLDATIKANTIKADIRLISLIFPGNLRQTGNRSPAAHTPEESVPSPADQDSADRRLRERSPAIPSRR